MMIRNASDLYSRRLSIASVIWRLAASVILVGETYAFASDFSDRGLTDAWLKVVPTLMVLTILTLVSVGVGIPLYLAYRARQITNWWAYAAGAASIAGAVYAFPDVLSTGSNFSARSGGHDIIINGYRTAYGWIIFWEGVALYADLGAASGLIFWFLLRVGRKAFDQAGS